MAQEQKPLIVVALDSWVRFPPLDIDILYTLQQHHSTRPHELIDRVKDATVICTSATRIPREAILAAPNLRLISTNATGTDNIDKTTALERGVSVSHVPAQNTASVTEHALALYYALRRRILPLHELTVRGQGWSATGGPHPAIGPPPRTNREETVVIFGYGAIGQNMARVATALGMKVLVAERKGAGECRPGRTPFVESLRRGTVFFQIAPLDASTFHMLGAEELATMDPSAYVINVGRAAVIDEEALVDALRGGRLAGAATDVFVEEPASAANSLLVDPSIPNLILSPHIAWYSQATLDGTRDVVKGNIEGFLTGRPQNLVVNAIR